MRGRGTGWSKWAVWLGVIALAINSLVPIHLAFDLANALAARTHRPEIAGGTEARVLGWLCGHFDDHEDHHHGAHHGAQCPVCSVTGSLAALAQPANPVLPVPRLVAAVHATVLPAAAHRSIQAASYRSRAPPTA